MRELPAHLDRNLRELCLLPRGASLLVAVSGGADSIALLHALAIAAPRYPWRLAVAHFDHRLRGAGSAADAEFVAAEAARLGFPFHGGAAAHRVPKTPGVESTEMAARRLRHAFLARTAREANADAVVLAHHADDQTETFLLRLLRGSGGSGLGGMRWNSHSPADSGVRLCRPLLDIPRSALRAWLAARGIGFREDPSNADRAFARNDVRHRLLPFLREFEGLHVDKVLLRVAELTSADADFVAAIAAAWDGAEPFAALHPAVQRAVIRDQLFALGQEPTFELVERLRRQPTRRASSGRARSWRQADGIVADAPVPSGFRAGQRVLPLDGPTRRARWHGLEARWKIFAGTDAADRPEPLAGRESFDLDAIGGTATLRHWKPGDRFRPLGLPAPSKLQDLFVNRRVPAAERRDRIVAMDGDGQIFWVEGLPPGHEARVTGRTRRRLDWCWKRAVSER